MGHKLARRELDLEAEIKRINNRVIIHAIRHKNDLDEA